MKGFVNILSFLKNLKLIDKLYWRKIGIIVIISWISFFVISTITMFAMWMKLSIIGEVWFIISVLTIVFLITGIPGSMALIQRTIRKKLYTIPEAAALSAFTLSFILGFGLLFCINVLLFLLNEPFMCFRKPCGFFNVVLDPMLTGLFIGIIAFPLTIGLVFPFGICAGCALIIWIMIDENGLISKKSWNIYVGVSTLSWMLLIVVGYALGFA